MAAATTPRVATAPTPAEASKPPPKENRGARHEEDPEDLRNRLAQNRVDHRCQERVERAEGTMQQHVSRSRTNYSARSSPETDEDEFNGRLCFTREIRETRGPKKFKLMAETPKYDGSQEPRAWLDDYLIAVRFQRGHKITAMQYI